MADFKLYPHQKQNVEHLIAALKTHGGALDASVTGTGKTLTFLALCKQVGAQPAIVTHKAIIPGWQRACQQIGVDPLFIANYEACKTAGFKYGKVLRKQIGIDETKVTGYDWQLPHRRVVFAFDEAQALRNVSSINSKIAMGAYQLNKTCLLSATPFQSPLECGTIGRILDLFPKSRYYAWLFAHGCKRAYHGGLEFIGDIPDGNSKPAGTNAERGRMIMAALHAELFPSRGCRTTHEDIPGFPKTQILCDELETGEADAIAAAYLAELQERKAEDHARACAEVDPEFHDLVEVLPVVRNLRHRQQVELLKCRAMAEFAVLAAQKGDSVALFVNFDASIEALSAYLNCKYIIRGDRGVKGTSNVERSNVIRAFQANTTPFVIVNSAAGGAGLSLHDEIGQVARTSLISPPASAVRLQQILGRVHRLGGGYSTQRLVFAANTVETRIMQKLQTRMGNLAALTDGDLDPFSYSDLTEAPVVIE